MSIDYVRNIDCGHIRHISPNGYAIDRHYHFPLIRNPIKNRNPKLHGVYVLFSCASCELPLYQLARLNPES